jgi:uncharacterized protein (DUF488 family)
MPRIFTIGHSTHASDELLALLETARIALLADVRRYPSSRRFPQFGAGQLESSLAELGVEYLHVPALGGRRDPLSGSANTGWRVGQFRGYADHMASEEFRRELERLAQHARRCRVAVMCAEADWRRCHRRLLSDALLTEGLEVVHLGPRGESELHELTPFAVVEDGLVSYPEEQGRLEV